MQAGDKRAMVAFFEHAASEGEPGEADHFRTPQLQVIHQPLILFIPVGLVPGRHCVRDACACIDDRAREIVCREYVHSWQARGSVPKQHAIVGSQMRPFKDSGPIFESNGGLARSEHLALDAPVLDSRAIAEPRREKRTPQLLHLGLSCVVDKRKPLLPHFTENNKDIADAVRDMLDRVWKHIEKCNVRKDPLLELDTPVDRFHVVETQFKRAIVVRRKSLRRTGGFCRANAQEASRLGEKKPVIMKRLANGQSLLSYFVLFVGHDTYVSYLSCTV
jgi:hypothetical protein